MDLGRRGALRRIDLEGGPRVESEGEVLPPGDGSIRAVACPRPFSTETVERFFDSGATLQEIAEALQPDIRYRRLMHASIDGDYIPEDLWRRVRPKPGRLVNLRAVPAGPGGKKNIFRLVLMIAVLAASIFAPPLLGVEGALIATSAGTAILTNAAALSAAIFVAGALAINFLVPPPKANLSALAGAGGRDSATLSLQGARNRADPYGPVPKLYGKFLVTPKYGARPFTEIRGKDQYLRMLFDLGPGPLDITDLKIGQTPIENFEDVKFEIRQGWPDDPPLTLYTRNVLEEVFTVLLDAATSWVVRITQPDTDEISLDITFGQGLVQFDDAGNKTPRTVQIDVEYRAVGAVPWNSAVAAVALGSRTTGALQRPAPKVVHQETIHVTRVFKLSLDPITGKIHIAASALSSFTATIPRNNKPVCNVTLSSDSGVAPTLQDTRTAEFSGPGYFAPALNLPAITVTIGAGTLQPPAFLVTDSTTAAVRRHLSIAVDRGQYEVRVKRTTADSNNDKILDKAFWSALRSIRNEAPIAATGHAQIALEIRATDQLNGIVDEFNCVAQSILLDWDGAAWLERATSNPAAIYADVLRGTANKRPVADGRVDWDRLEDWADDCRINAREFNAVLDFRSSVYETLRAVASTGRADFAMRDGKYSVVRDIFQTVPVQLCTPRNSWGFRGSKAFPDDLHGLKIRFANREKGWKIDERIVYADGFNAANASDFETLDFFGITDPAQIFKDARYHQAVAKLRPELFELNCDMEHLVARVGNLVLLSHDVILIGIAAGRIKTVTTDGGGNVTAVTVDELLPMEAGKSYGMSIRTVLNAKVTGQVLTVEGENASVTFTTPIPAAQAPQAGDLFGFGELGKETLECLVKAIRRGRDLSAQLILVEHAPAVHTADQGPIPPHDSMITLPPEIAAGPQKPRIDAVRSDETVLARQPDGSFESRIVMTLSRAATAAAPATAIEVRFRRSDSTGGTWSRMPPFPGDAVVVWAAPVDDKVAYDLQLRALDGDTGAASEWVLIDDHVVVGKSSPPPDPTGLLIEGAEAAWSFPAIMPRDFAGSRLKFNPGNNATWASATALHDGILAQTRFPIAALMNRGLMTVMVKGVDVAENESANAAVAVINLGDATPFTVLAHRDYAAENFPGTVVDGTITGGEIRADGTGGPFWSGNDSAPFWSGEDAALFWTGAGFKTFTYTSTFSVEIGQTPSKLRIEPVVTGAGWTLEYRPRDSQAPFWSGNDGAVFWSGNDAALMWGAAGPFLPWPGEIAPSAQTYEFRITVAGGSVQGILTGLTATLIAEEIEDNIDDLAVSVDGNRLPLNRSFREIRNVQLTLQFDGGTAVSAKTIDKNPALGPLVQCFDTLGSPTTGLLDAHVSGV